MDTNKPQYSDFLNLFFRGAKKHRHQQPFTFRERDEKKVKLVQKYLKNEFSHDETDVRNETARVYNVAVTQNFFQENRMLSELNDLFSASNLRFNKVSENFRFALGDDFIEFDLMAYGDDILLVTNIYAVVDEEDIAFFAEDIHEIRDALPEFAGYKIYGAIGVLEIEPEHVKYAAKRGFFVIKKTGDTISLANRKTFKPKEW